MRTALLAFMALVASGFADASHLDSIDAYGTFASGGITATVSGDTHLNAIATLEVRAPGASDYRPAHPLVRIDATHFVGSLFWLQSGARYGVRVTLSDSDGVDGSASMTADLATRAEDTPFVPTRTLYVAPSGSDEAAGTDPAHPLATIQRAANLAQPGDLVSVAPGVYRESVNVATSGTEVAPIVFRGAAGAIVDGADPALVSGAAWTDRGNGIWSIATGYATDLVVSDTGRLFDYESLDALASLEAGAPGGSYADGNDVYVKFSDGSTPAQHAMNVSRFDAGFYVDGASHVRIENFEIRYYGSDAFGRAVYLRYANDCKVSGSSLHENGAAGVWIKGGSRNVIEENDIGDSSITNWPWALTHESTAQNTGVDMTDDSGRGNVIRRNALHGTYDGAHPCGDSAPPDAFTSETDVYENTIFDHADDAIESEGYCANVRIFSNTIRDTLMAVAVAPAAPGPTWIVRNTAYDYGNVPSHTVFGQTPSAIKINSDYPEPVGPLLVYHNTFVTTVEDADAVTFFEPGFATWLYSADNVFVAPHNALRKVNEIPLILDFDDLWSSDGAALVSWYGTNYATLADAQQALGIEPNGISANPMLTNPAGGDFTPGAASPLIDRGTVIVGIDDDVADDQPDIGAVERVVRGDGIFADGFED